MVQNQEGAKACCLVARNGIYKLVEISALLRWRVKMIKISLLSVANLTNSLAIRRELRLDQKDFILFFFRH